MNYQQTTKYLFGLQRFGSKLDLRNITRLLELVGNPQHKFKAVHVGGTSGKFSVVQMTATILQAAGHRVGTFTSPHLSRYSERFCINGKEIGEDDIVVFTSRLKEAADQMDRASDYRHPTFFEMSTALAFLYFAEQEVDIAVVEVGLGGRLDATNVLEPLVSVITHIDLEHTHVLGETIEEIAGEKAGIIKDGGTLITGENDIKVLSVLFAVSREKNADMQVLGKDFSVKSIKVDKQNQSGQKFLFKHAVESLNLFIPLLGEVQIKNTALAVMTSLILRKKGFAISDKSIVDGLRAVKCPGRLEILQKSPFIILDCAKDPAAVSELRRAIEKFFDFDRLILVMAVSDDKDIKKMVKNIAPITDLAVATKHNIKERALDPQKIAVEFSRVGVETVIKSDMGKAIEEAEKRAQPDDLILITGSVFAVGEAREIWYDKTWNR